MISSKNKTCPASSINPSHTLKSLVAFEALCASRVVYQSAVGEEKELYRVRGRIPWELFICKKMTLRKFRMGKNDEGFVNYAGVLPVVITDRMLKCSTPEPVVFVFSSVS